MDFKWLALLSFVVHLWPKLNVIYTFCFQGLFFAKHFIMSEFFLTKKIQAVVDGSKQRIESLENQWEKHKEKLMTQYEEAKKINETRAVSSF